MCFGKYNYKLKYVGDFYRGCGKTFRYEYLALISITKERFGWFRYTFSCKRKKNEMLLDTYNWLLERINL